MRTLSGIILELRRRPGLIYGSTPSLDVMWAYFAGIDFGESLSHVPYGQTLKGFKNWISEREGVDTTTEIFQWFRTGVSEAEAVERFLALFSEYCNEYSGAGEWNENREESCQHCCRFLGIVRN